MVRKEKKGGSFAVDVIARDISKIANEVGDITKNGSSGSLSRFQKLSQKAAEELPIASSGDVLSSRASW